MDTSIENDPREPMLGKSNIGSDEYNRLKEKYRKLEYSYGWKMMFYLNVFLACASFSIVLPSLWPYLQTFEADENFLASVLAIYSIGEFFGAIMWGYIYNASSMKFSLYSCIICGFIGSILYSMGGYFIPWGKWLVFAGRFIQGLWTGGQQAIEQAYITECIDKNQNLSMIADLGASAVLGFVLGPIIGLLGRFVNFNIGSFYVDEYTSSGYFQAIFTIVMFLGTMFLFTEIPREWRRGLQEDDEDDNEEDVSIETESANAILKQNKDILFTNPAKVDFSKIDDEEKDTLSRLKPNMKGVVASLVIFLIHFNGFAVQETITTPISTDITHKYTDTLDYPESFAYLLFAASGVLSLITFLLLKRITAIMDDTTFVLISSIMGMVGYFLLIDFTPRVIEPVRFIIGFCIISVTFPLGRGVTLSMFSKIIGKHKAGVYMGYMLAVGAISRIIGPFWSVQSLSVSPALTFGICSLLFLVNIIVQWYYSAHLHPHWSYFIEIYEEKIRAKVAGEDPKKVSCATPGSIHPMSPSPGYIQAKPSKFPARPKFENKA
jgi:ceroid-lipofuscinosis MFS transporter 7